MDKLYWIVCEEAERTLFEGRFQGRTRGAAMKHLKEQVGREKLNGLVYTITEIPVPLIREIVAEILGQSEQSQPVPEIHPEAPTEPQPGERYDAFEAPPQEPEPEAPPATPFSQTEPRPSYDWERIKECYMQGRGPKEVSRMMDVPLNTLSGRIRREGWARQRREVRQ